MRIKKLASVGAQVVDAYNSGATMDELAVTYGVSKGTIRNHLKASGANIRKTGRRSNSNVPVAYPTRPDNLNTGSWEPVGSSN